MQKKNDELQRKIESVNNLENSCTLRHNISMSAIITQISPDGGKIARKSLEMARV